MSRLGIGHFKIADPDIYEFSNINCQIGATQGTIGQAKTRVMCNRILSINPDAQVDASTEPISKKNIDAFMDGCDLVIDGIDFFELDAKQMLFQRARETGIPVITSCPLGFGASVMIFSPKGMSYENYFDLREGLSEQKKRSRVSYGLSPSPLCFKYMARRRSVLISDVPQVSFRD